MLLTLLAALLVGAAVAQFATFLTTVYLHRALSHRSITMRPGLTFAFRFLLWISVGIRAREWVAVHRKHHAFDPAWPAISMLRRAHLLRIRHDGVKLKQPSHAA